MDEVKKKRCTKCGGEYPATEEYFYYNKSRGRLSPTCKICERKLTAARARQAIPLTERNLPDIPFVEARLALRYLGIPPFSGRIEILLEKLKTYGLAIVGEQQRPGPAHRKYLYLNKQDVLDLKKKLDEEANKKQAVQEVVTPAVIPPPKDYDKRFDDLMTVTCLIAKRVKALCDSWGVVDIEVK